MVAATPNQLLGRGFLVDAASVPREVVAQGGPSPSADVLISVVVPTRNRQHLVEETIRALFQQTLSIDHYEVIVVDNASDDQTAEMLKRVAAESPCPFRAVRLYRDHGPSVSRNVGVVLARGSLLAFTDSDCVPTPGWLQAGVAAFKKANVGIVQGRTQPHPEQQQPFFNHFIEIGRFDGTFSTCNVFYSRDAVVDVGGFDPRCVYWEDVDLGWRVRRRGWDAAFAADALVYHQVIPLSLVEWLRWPLHFAVMPAKVERYPEYRQYLFLGVWVHWFHALFQLALVALVLGAVVRRIALVLAIPYLVAFPRQHGLRGRWPPIKAVLHLAWDAVSFGVLLVSSLRHRALVL